MPFSVFFFSTNPPSRREPCLHAVGHCSSYPFELPGRAVAMQWRQATRSLFDVHSAMRSMRSSQTVALSVSRRSMQVILRTTRDVEKTRHWQRPIRTARTGSEECVVTVDGRGK